MENTLPNPENQDPAIPSQVCASCRQQDALPGHPTPLCQDCRNHFVRYPIPKWIWAFAAGVAVVMVISLIRMPGYLTTAIHMLRAKKAIAAKNYLTAEKEATLAAKALPGNLEAQSYLIIAMAYNHSSEDLQPAYAAIKGREYEDHDLYTSVDNALNYAEQFYPGDTSMMRIADSVAAGGPAAIMAYYRNSMPERLVASDKRLMSAYFAGRLYDLDDYNDADTILSAIRKSEGTYYPGDMLYVNVKRHTKDYAGAAAICDELMQLNHEDYTVMAARAKVEVTFKHDDLATKYAKQAVALAPEDTYTLSALALANFYANKIEDSKKVLAQINKIEAAKGDTSIGPYIGRVIAGTESFR